MTFDDILAQVLDLLQRQGRVSYRALKRRFDIDDEYIEDLKAEIIQAQRLAIDEDGAVLVWTGEIEEKSAPASLPDQPEPYPVVAQVQTVRETSSSVEPHTPEAERRHLTVMFCDLVGSTRLSGEFDPEDYRAVVRQYQQVCAEVIQRYDGHIAQYLGDGLLVYFGFPQAHEDDAQRAIYSGLGMIKAIDDLNSRLEQDQGVKLAVRLGIHTGLVVVGDMGREGRQEQLALGETPNLAARIQGIAQPDTVVMSADTYRLTQGYFECESLGEHDLRGVAHPIALYRVLGDTGIQSRLDVAFARGLTPLVGRKREVDLLLGRWEQAKEGQGQVVLLSGEAGIGKSRLVQVLKDHVSDEPHTRLEYRSSPYFTNSALYPIIDMVQRTLRFQPDDTPEQKREKLTHHLSQYRLPLEESVPLFASLLSFPVPEDQYPPLNLSPQRQREKTLEAIVANTLEMSEQQPVLFILEDLHWTDPTTLEFLDLLIDQTPTASMCALLTCRPEFQPTWSYRSYLTEVTINRLSSAQVEQVVERLTGGKRLPAVVLEQIVEKTDGVPLYVEEMTKAVMEAGVLKDINGQYEMTGSIATLHIPATLQDSLMARLDRLVTAKAVAQYASVIGRQFSYELLQAVSELDNATLQRELGRLVESELVYQRGLPPQATYTFKHALIQDTAYESLLRSTRQDYHRRIAEILVERFSETAAAQPELLAHHYTAAGLSEQAIGYWQMAGEEAIQRSAHVEATAHLTQGLELLKTLPETPDRDQYELILLCTLGAPLIVIKGYAAPEVEYTFSRARELCQQVGETSQLFRVLYGLYGFYQVRAELRTAYDLGMQLLDLAQHQNVPHLLLVAHFALGVAMYHTGEVTSSLEHLDQTCARYDPRHHPTQTALYGVDFGVFAHTYSSHTLWLLGYPTQALTRCEAGLSLAQELSHPFNIALALAYLAMLYQFRGELHAAHERAEAAIALCTEHGFGYYLAWGMLIQGWARFEQDRGEAGIVQMRQGLAAIEATGAELRQPYYLSLMAAACGVIGQTEEGLALLDEALHASQTKHETWWDAELYRLTGTGFLRQAEPDTHQAETCFHTALGMAQSQQAKSLELRAATSLARLWQSQGKRDEARELLEPVYGWFTEGFDTADLQEAKQLLDELAA